MSDSDSAFVLESSFSSFIAVYHFLIPRIPKQPTSDVGHVHMRTQMAAASILCHARSYLPSTEHHCPLLWLILIAHTNGGMVSHGQVVYDFLVY